MPPVKVLIREPTAPLGAPASSATVRLSAVSARTGASLSATTWMVASALLDSLTPSLTWTTTRRSLVSGSSLPLLKATALIAAW
ncbi:hypothetical protein D3C81_2164940 [compost metagenome]